MVEEICELSFSSSANDTDTSDSSVDLLLMDWMDFSSQVFVVKAIDMHPDNQKLEKKKNSNGDDSPVECRRRCTDVAMLLLLVCSWAAMTGVGLAAMGIFPSKYIRAGDPRRLVNGIDYHGNMCGITNYMTPNGDDTIDLPKAYPLPSGFSACVESCPTKTNYDAFICEYEVQAEIDDLFGVSEMTGERTDVINESKKSLYLFYASRKQCMPEIASVPFLGYCLPQLKLDELILRANSTLAGSYDVLIPVANKASSHSSDFFDKAMADVMNVKYTIFAFGCGMSLCLGILFLAIIQIPCVLSLLLWLLIIAIDVGLVAAGLYSAAVSKKWAADEIRPRNEAAALFYASYVLYVLAGLWLIVIIFLRKRIVLAVACVREAAKAIGRMPMLSLFPVFQVLGLLAFSIIWGVYMAYLGSSGDIVVECMCPLSSNATLVETVKSIDGICNDGCIKHTELKYTKNTKYAGLYMVFVWLWTSQFIVAVGQLVVSLAISLWYFSRNKKLLKGSTGRAISIVTRYHLGTAALGGLIISIVKTISAILTYIQNKAVKSKLRVAIVLLSVLKCLLWCVEKILKFINKQAYVQTAIFGYSFCKASRCGFFLILRNALRISAVSIVSKIVIFVAKVFITVASATGGYHYLDIYHGDELNYLMLPTALIGLLAYAVSEMFDEVFGMAISTILQCFVVDEEMFDPEDRFASPRLVETIDSTQLNYKKKSKKSIDVDTITQ